MDSDRKIISFEEVAKHNVIKDCWVIVFGKVYDLSPFMDDHPGGDEVLLSATGKDATSDFEDVGHSDNARELMKQYCIGEIDVLTVPLKRTYVLPPSTLNKPDNTSGFGIKILQLLVPLLIIGLAMAIRKYTKND